MKYEEVYLADYQCGEETFRGLDRYLRFYNGGRRHQSLGYKTPHEVYIEGKEPGTRNGTTLTYTAHIPANLAWN